MRKLLAVIGLTLALLVPMSTSYAVPSVTGGQVTIPAEGGVISDKGVVSPPVPQATERFIWTACGSYGYRQIGPDDSRIMRFRSCVRVFQALNPLSGQWVSKQINSHGEVLCRVNVPHTSAPIADRFALGTNHACSMNLVVGITFANGEEPGDSQNSDSWSVRSSGNDGLWFKCLGDDCSTLNGYWDHCVGSDAWHARFTWIDGGLDDQRRFGEVHTSRSAEFLC
jgi:hypothetical protein